MEPDFECIGDRIRMVMARQGLTQRELARRAGFAPTQISVILARLEERPYAIELETLVRIAQGADVSLLWLLTGIAETRERVPPALADRTGWDAAAAEVAPYLPNASEAHWNWVAGVRLPDRPTPVHPSPFVLQELLTLAAQLFPRRPFSPAGVTAAPAVPRRAPKAVTKPPRPKAAKRRG
jgi:transcriptional regulator with XRE-family HTH domain